jgi:hypothetical protein
VHAFFVFRFRADFFKLIVIFIPVKSIKKTDCPVLQKGVKNARKNVSLETKILVMRKMEAGEKRVNTLTPNDL